MCASCYQDIGKKAKEKYEKITVSKPQNNNIHKMKITNTEDLRAELDKFSPEQEREKKKRQK